MLCIMIVGNYLVDMFESASWHSKMKSTSENEKNSIRHCKARK